MNAFSPIAKKKNFKQNTKTGQHSVVLTPETSFRFKNACAVFGLTQQEMLSQMVLKCLSDIELTSANENSRKETRDGY